MENEFSNDSVSFGEVRYLMKMRRYQWIKLLLLSDVQLIEVFLVALSDALLTNKSKVLQAGSHLEAIYQIIWYLCLITRI